MSGLNRGNRNTLRGAKKDNYNLREEGVFYSDKSAKWVVRIYNNTNSKNIKPTKSIAQFVKKQDAEKFFKEYKSKLK